ncbi:MAG: hypothetical protein N2C12_17690 [Planctomycetales bacterium]
MKFLLVIATMALTILCWGAYGPILHDGKLAMGDHSLLPFFFVGVAYFLIAVAVPAVLLNMRGEKGSWTASGIFWSLVAGAAGAIGALGIILAFAEGYPIYVMPIVFGGAPIINSLVTMAMNKTKSIGPLFLAGLIMVIAGSVTVMLFKPAAPATAVDTVSASPEESESELPAETSFVAGAVYFIIGIAMAVFCWGVYGPILHKGQMKMNGSRLRPLICVGLAYFGIAVAIPSLLLSAGVDGGWGSYDFTGSIWSLFAGGAGVLGALGVIMAFNFGGKPIYVMPLIFGGAPVVNTFISIYKTQQIGQIAPMFWSGLILVIVGAAVVLVFSPKGKPHTATPSDDADGEKQEDNKSVIADRKSGEESDESPESQQPGQPQKESG